QNAAAGGRSAARLNVYGQNSIEVEVQVQCDLLRRGNHSFCALPDLLGDHLVHRGLHH
ncbi:unnamed protein product, partial [Heterosigma akashiwo]